MSGDSTRASKARPSRRSVLKAGATGAAALLTPPFVFAAESPARQPNIVFVFADQLRTHEVGCYGNDRLHTPNIDALAREGARFTNAISTYPLCSPFRAMLLTGMQPMANGMVTNDHRLRAGVPSFAEACKSAGYHTAYIGKWHIDGHGRSAYIPPDRRLGFQKWMVLECTHDYFKSNYHEGDSPQMRTWEGYDAIAQTRAAQQYLRERADQGPFALFVSWGPPHNPYVAPDAYMKRFQPKQMRLRENVAEHEISDAMLANSRSPLPKQQEAQRRRIRQQINDDNAIRRWYAGYYAATEAIDDCVGDLRRTLAELKMLDETVFVFTSDHGDMLGSHRFYEKTVPFEEAVSIPFVVRYPRKMPAGIVSDGLLGPIDMMPTVLSLAGIPCPKVDGMDLSHLAMGKPGPQRDALLMMTMTCALNSWTSNGTDPWRAVRTKTHTYAKFADGRPWLLFDNAADPHQVRNLVGRPETAPLQRQLDSHLNELCKEAKDPVDVTTITQQVLKENPGNALIRGYLEAYSGRG